MFEKSSLYGSGKLEARVLEISGKIAGLAGLAVGSFFLIIFFVIKNEIITSGILEPRQAFSLILVMMILSFGLSAVGVVGWYVARTTPNNTMPTIQVVFLVVLIISVLGAAVFVSRDKRNSPEAGWQDLVAAGCWLFEPDTPDLISDNEVLKASIAHAQGLLAGANTIFITGIAADPGLDRNAAAVLAERRASVVRGALSGAGISEASVKLVSKGKEITPFDVRGLPATCGAKVDQG